MKPFYFRHINLLAVSFTFMTVLLFIHPKFRGCRFESPQVIKHVVAEQLTQELILDSFASQLESSKIYLLVKKAVIHFLHGDQVA